MCVYVCVRACVRVRACERACVRACVRVWVGGWVCARVFNTPNDWIRRFIRYDWYMSTLMANNAYFCCHCCGVVVVAVAS